MSQHKWTQLTQQMHAPKLTGCQHDHSSSANEIEVSDLDDGEGTNHNNKKTRKCEKAKTFKNEDLLGYPGTKKNGRKELLLCFVIMQHPQVIHGNSAGQLNMHSCSGMSIFWTSDTLPS